MQHYPNTFAWFNLVTKFSPEVRNKWEVKKEEVETVDPPFTNLPSFLVAAIVLSYLCNGVDLKYYLDALSRNSRKYFKSHKSFLKLFVIEWLPKLFENIDFGDQKFRLQGQ